MSSKGPNDADAFLSWLASSGNTGAAAATAFLPPRVPIQKSSSAHHSQGTTLRLLPRSPLDDMASILLASADANPTGAKKAGKDNKGK